MPFGIGQGRKVVTTAGTEVALESEARWVSILIITAETDNTDYIVVGADGVIEADATRTGVPLSAGDSLTLYDVNTNMLYIDAGANGDGVTFMWLA